METTEAVEALGALAQETRLKICQILAGAGAAGLPAGDIALALGVPQNTLSFHLGHLEQAGLVTSRRQGRYIIYSARTDMLAALTSWLDSILNKQSP